MNDWWMEGSGEITRLNIELLQVAYVALDLTHAPAAMSTPTISTDFPGVDSPLPGRPALDVQNQRLLLVAQW